MFTTTRTSRPYLDAKIETVGENESFVSQFDIDAMEYRSQNKIPCIRKQPNLRLQRTSKPIHKQAMKKMPDRDPFLKGNLYRALGARNENINQDGDLKRKPSSLKKYYTSKTCPKCKPEYCEYWHSRMSPYRKLHYYYDPAYIEDLKNKQQQQIQEPISHQKIMYYENPEGKAIYSDSPSIEVQLENEFNSYLNKDKDCQEDEDKYISKATAFNSNFQQSIRTPLEDTFQFFSPAKVEQHLDTKTPIFQRSLETELEESSSAQPQRERSSMLYDVRSSKPEEILKSTKNSILQRPSEMRSTNYTDTMQDYNEYKQQLENEILDSYQSNQRVQMQIQKEFDDYLMKEQHSDYQNLVQQQQNGRLKSQPESNIKSFQIEKQGQMKRSEEKFTSLETELIVFSMVDFIFDKAFEQALSDEKQQARQRWQNEDEVSNNSSKGLEIINQPIYEAISGQNQWQQSQDKLLAYEEWLLQQRNEDYFARMKAQSGADALQNESLRIDSLPQLSNKNIQTSQQVNSQRIPNQSHDYSNSESLKSHSSQSLSSERIDIKELLLPKLQEEALYQNREVASSENSFEADDNTQQQFIPGIIEDELSRKEKEDKNKQTEQIVFSPNFQNNVTPTRYQFVNKENQEHFNQIMENREQLLRNSENDISLKEFQESKHMQQDLGDMLDSMQLAVKNIREREGQEVQKQNGSPSGLSVPYQRFKLQNQKEQHDNQRTNEDIRTKEEALSDVQQDSSSSYPMGPFQSNYITIAENLGQQEKDSEMIKTMEEPSKQRVPISSIQLPSKQSYLLKKRDNNLKQTASSIQLLKERDQEYEQYKRDNGSGLGLQNQSSNINNNEALTESQGNANDNSIQEERIREIPSHLEANQEPWPQSQIQIQKPETLLEEVKPIKDSEGKQDEEKLEKKKTFKNELETYFGQLDEIEQEEGIIQQLLNTSEVQSASQLQGDKDRLRRSAYKSENESFVTCNDQTLGKIDSNITIHPYNEETPEIQRLVDTQIDRVESDLHQKVLIAEKDLNLSKARSNKSLRTSSQFKKEHNSSEEIPDEVPISNVIDYIDQIDQSHDIVKTSPQKLGSQNKIVFDESPILMPEEFLNPNLKESQKLEAKPMNGIETPNTPKGSMVEPNTQNFSQEVTYVVENDEQNRNILEEEFKDDRQFYQGNGSQHMTEIIQNPEEFEQAFAHENLNYGMNNGQDYPDKESKMTMQFLNNQRNFYDDNNQYQYQQQDSDIRQMPFKDYIECVNKLKSSDQTHKMEQAEGMKVEVPQDSINEQQTLRVQGQYSEQQPIIRDDKILNKEYNQTQFLSAQDIDTPKVFQNQEQQTPIFQKHMSGSDQVRESIPQNKRVLDSLNSEQHVQSSPKEVMNPEVVQSQNTDGTKMKEDVINNQRKVAVMDNGHIKLVEQQVVEVPYEQQQQFQQQPVKKSRNPFSKLICGCSSKQKRQTQNQVPFKLRPIRTPMRSSAPIAPLKLIQLHQEPSVQSQQQQYQSQQANDLNHINVESVKSGDAHAIAAQKYENEIIPGIPRSSNLSQHPLDKNVSEQQELDSVQQIFQEQDDQQEDIGVFNVPQTLIKEQPTFQKNEGFRQSQYSNSPKQNIESAKGPQKINFGENINNFKKQEHSFGAEDYNGGNMKIQDPISNSRVQIELISRSNSKRSDQGSQHQSERALQEVQCNHSPVRISQKRKICPTCRQAWNGAEAIEI